MGQKIITLSGAATDVLYALFFRGALQSGELPAKSGAAELRELGFAETRHTATEYQKENYFTFLTSEGQKFAIKHLVNTRFGVPAGDYIGSPLDALDEIADLPRYKIGSDYAIQKKIADALDTALARHYEQFGNAEREKQAVIFLEDRWVAIEGSYTPEEIIEAVECIKLHRLSKKIKESMEDISGFAVKDGQIYIKDAFIENGAASANYTVKMNVNHNGKSHAEGISTSNASATKTRLSDDIRETLNEVVNDGIRNALKPGGLLFGEY